MPSPLVAISIAHLRPATRQRLADGELSVHEASSQNSALLGTLQRANCLLVVPEGLKGYAAGDEVDCVRIDLPEGSVL